MVPTRISFDNTGSDIYTIIEVETRDRPGLLYDLARTLTANNISIASAIIATYGKQAIDVFYVKDLFGLKLHAESKRRTLETRLKAASTRRTCRRAMTRPRRRPRMAAAVRTVAARLYTDIKDSCARKGMQPRERPPAEPLASRRRSAFLPTTSRKRARAKDPHPPAPGLLTVGCWTMVSRVLGLARDVLMAALLGTGPVAQAFLIAFTLPNMFRRFFAEGAFNLAFVPMFAKSSRRGEDAARLRPRRLLRPRRRS